MSANPQGSNPFATNNSGGGVGLITANPNFSNTTQSTQPGSYTPYQTPEWIQGGMTNSMQPIQNYPVTNYGRWNSQGGATNGWGMSMPSPWPNPSSITQPGGSGPLPPATTAQPNAGGVPPNPYLPKQGTPISDPTGQPVDHRYLGPPSQGGPGLQGGAMGRGPAGDTWGAYKDQQRAAAQSPQALQSAFSQLQGAQNPASWMTTNSRLLGPLQRNGMLTPDQINSGFMNRQF